ncbi:hypothetical protein BDZ89DRAFT_1161031 [Hymenopellis radicata]|nr:hypothetical protein BDZ89DRAFT_1161031 [Hymenopellis radicata]
MSSALQQLGLSVADAQYLLATHLHSTILFVFCHGIHTVVFFVALYYANRQQSILIAIITFLWCSQTVVVGLNWKAIDECFITHGLSLDMELAFYQSGAMPGGISSDILHVVTVVFADIILIWRCWVWYGRNWIVVAALALCLVTETIVSGFILSGSNLYASVGIFHVNWNLVSYAVAMLTNTFYTFLVLVRILRITGIRASLATYRGMTELFVESAALYSVAYAVLLGIYAYEYYSPNASPVIAMYHYPKAVASSITGIAPTLIVACIMANDSWARAHVKSLRFESGVGPGPQTQTRRTVDLEENSSVWYNEPGSGSGDSIASRGVRPRTLLPHGRF